MCGFIKFVLGVVSMRLAREETICVIPHGSPDPSVGLKPNRADPKRQLAAPTQAVGSTQSGRYDEEARQGTPEDDKSEGVR